MPLPLRFSTLSWGVEEPDAASDSVEITLLSVNISGTLWLLMYTRAIRLFGGIEAEAEGSCLASEECRSVVVGPCFGVGVMLAASPRGMEQSICSEQGGIERQMIVFWRSCRLISPFSSVEYGY